MAVTHTAGFAGGVPDATLVSAATLLSVYSYNTDSKLGFESERIGQYAYKLGSGSGSDTVGGGGAGGWPSAVARLLAQWQRPFADWS